jgi:hypothetical protein
MKIQKQNRLEHKTGWRDTHEGEQAKDVPSSNTTQESTDGQNTDNDDDDDD